MCYLSPGLFIFENRDFGSRSLQQNLVGPTLHPRGWGKMFFHFIYYSLFYVYEYVACMYASTLVSCCLQRPEEGVGSLELDADSCTVCAGNGTQILQEQLVLFTTKPSLHPWENYFKA